MFLCPHKLLFWLVQQSAISLPSQDRARGMPEARFGGRANESAARLLEVEEFRRAQQLGGISAGFPPGLLRPVVGRPARGAFGESFSTWVVNSHRLAFAAHICAMKVLLPGRKQFLFAVRRCFATGGNFKVFDGGCLFLFLFSETFFSIRHASMRSRRGFSLGMCKAAFY